MGRLCDQCEKVTYSGNVIEIYELTRVYYRLNKDGTLADPDPTAIPLKVEFCSARCLCLFVKRDIEPEARPSLHDVG